MEDNRDASQKDSECWVLCCAKPSPELAATIEQRVAARIQAGDFIPDTIQYFQEVSFKPVSGALTVSDKRLEQLQKLCQLWDVRLRPQQVTSHRKILGPIIVAAKRLVYPVIGAFLKESLHQQRSFNAAAIALLAELSEEVERLAAARRSGPQ